MAAVAPLVDRLRIQETHRNPEWDQHHLLSRVFGGALPALRVFHFKSEVLLEEFVAADSGWWRHPTLTEMNLWIFGTIYWASGVLYSALGKLSELQVLSLRLKLPSPGAIYEPSFLVSMYQSLHHLQDLSLHFSVHETSTEKKNDTVIHSFYSSWWTALKLKPCARVSLCLPDFLFTPESQDLVLEDLTIDSRYIGEDLPPWIAYMPRGCSSLQLLLNDFRCPLLPEILERQLLHGTSLLRKLEIVCADKIAGLIGQFYSLRDLVLWLTVVPFMEFEHDWRDDLEAVETLRSLTDPYPGPPGQRRFYPFQNTGAEAESECVYQMLHREPSPGRFVGRVSTRSPIRSPFLRHKAPIPRRHWSRDLSRSIGTTAVREASKSLPRGSPRKTVIHRRAHLGAGKILIQIPIKDHHATRLYSRVEPLKLLEELPEAPGSREKQQVDRHSFHPHPSRPKTPPPGPHWASRAPPSRPPSPSEPPRVPDRPPPGSSSLPPGQLNPPPRRPKGMPRGHWRPGRLRLG